jgi:nucleoside-diphosphate-sugar epimerase
MKTYLVTGHLGFIGEHLTVFLINQGHKVIGIDNQKNGEYSIANRKKLEKFKIKQYNLSIQDLKEESIQEHIDGIFHVAAVPRVQYSFEHPQETNDSNISGTLAILEFARKKKIGKIVFSSSSSVYGNQKLLPLKESYIADPISPYAIQKYTGEIYMKLYNNHLGVKTVSLRYFNVYGPNQDTDHPYATLIPKAIRCALKNEQLTVYGDGTNQRDFCFVTDIIRANWLAMNSDKADGEVINIGAHNPQSVNNVLEYIQKLTEKKISVYIAPGRIEPKITYADVTKSQELLGWSPEIKIEEGLQKTIEWFKQQLKKIEVTR